MNANQKGQHWLVPFIIITCLVSDVWCQELCDSLVDDSSIRVDSTTLDALQTAGATFQDLVNCLEDGGGFILFDVRRFSFDSTVQTRNNITVTSTFAEGTRLSCSGAPMFDIRSATVNFTRVTIQDCIIDATSTDSAPIIVHSDASVTFQSVRVVNNINRRGPGAIRADPGSTVAMQDSYFGRNRGRLASVLAAGANCVVTVTNTSLEANRGRGGAIRMEGDDGTASVTIRNGSVFESNVAERGEGGALSVSGNVTVTIEDVRFRRNTAARRGGSLFLQTFRSASVRNSFFTENLSNFTGGGAIYAENSNGEMASLEISATIFWDNVARNYIGSGGALRLHGKDLACSISDSTSFTLNHAELYGGAVHASDVESLRIANATFMGNEALAGGGSALYVQSLGNSSRNTLEVDIEDSAFSFNQAMHNDHHGGSVAVVGARIEMSIANCHFNDNDVGIGNGGALLLFDGPLAMIQSSAFLRNRANFGGAIYAQDNVRYEVTGSLFERNAAGEGGALHTRGNVDLTLMQCNFTNNSALTEGGAIKVYDVIQGGQRTTFVMHNNIMFLNEAGSLERAEEAEQIAPSGGGIVFEGNGVDLEVTDSVFRRNRASQGGALYIKPVGDCNIAGMNIFSQNEAEYGGGIFMVVDENIQPLRYPFYHLSGTQFVQNSAQEGGAVYIMNNKLAVGNRSFNARTFIPRITGCTFWRNRARRQGGGFVLSGVAAQIGDDTFFGFNQVRARRGSVQFSRGGGVMIANGAVLRVQHSTFTNNVAQVGGAVSVFDASLEAGDVNFLQNRVQPGGVGGAVALEVSSNKDIPILNSDVLFLNIIFECSACNFTENVGSLRGGAVYLHHINPTAALPSSDELRSSSENGLSRISHERYLDRLRNRVVVFQNVRFERNAAQVGGAIFTNNPSMINASLDVNQINGATLSDVLQNAEYLEAAGISFEDNSPSTEDLPRGYGADFATTPMVPILSDYSHGQQTKVGNLTIDTFFSGDRLNITISFRDTVESVVNVSYSLTAFIEYDEALSEGKELDLSGQFSAEMDDTGMMAFTGTRLRGAPNTEYVLRIDYRANTEFLTYSTPPSYIFISMQPCRLGERTVTDGKVTECQPCNVGTFGRNPEQGTCASCADVDNANCFGQIIVPENDFWHSTSTSLKMYVCLGADSCDFPDRKSLIQEETLKAHAEGRVINYMDESDLLCGEGYRGPFCGTCERDYGRANMRCRKCGSATLQAFVLLAAIIWAIAFLTYFVRNVLELPQRLEFNRRLQRDLPNLRMRQQRASLEETIPGQTPQISRSWTLSDSTLPSRTGKLGRRLVAIIKSRHGDGEGELQPLTMANPAAEVLKITINFLQVTAAASTAYRLTEGVRKLLAAMGFCGNVASSYSFMYLDCFMDPDDNDKALRRMTITVLQPFMFFCLFVVFWLAVTKAKRMPAEYFSHRVWLTFLAINYFVYISLTDNLFQFLACAQIKDDDIDESQRTWYWKEDTAIECYSLRHAMLVGLMVVPLIGAVTIGFPLFIFCTLFRKRDQLNDESFIITYGFLYRAYNKPYWEVVIMFRKAAIAMVAVFAYSLGQNIQGLLSLLVIIIALSMHLYFQPYSQELSQLNRLETISLSTTIFVFVVGLMMNDPKLDNARTVLTVVTFLIVFAALATMIVELLRAMEEWMDMTIIKHDLMDIPALIKTKPVGKLRSLGKLYCDRLMFIAKDLSGSVRTQVQSTIRKRQDSGNKPHPDQAPDDSDIPPA